MTTRAAKLATAVYEIKRIILAPWYGPGDLNIRVLSLAREAVTEDDVMRAIEDGPNPERVDALREARAWAVLQRAAYASDGETPQRVAYGDMVNYLDNEIVKWSRGSEAAE